MATIANAGTYSTQVTTDDSPYWRQHFPYLCSITLPDVKVRQTVGGTEKIKRTRLLLVTRSDGVHKIGYLPRKDRDTRLGDGTKGRQAYLCKLGSILARKAGISSGGNHEADVVWDVVPEVLFGYEVFERSRLKVADGKAGDLYVVGHPVEGVKECLFRTPEEFAQHLWWLAEGDFTKACACVLCTKEAERKPNLKCNDRARSYLSSTTISSFWGDLPTILQN